MIVTCQECDTQFQLDDAKVPDDGVRVRCSRCKHSFFIESPRRSAADDGDVLAREAFGAEVPPRDAEIPGEAGLEDGESDWEFNEDVASPETEEEPDTRLAAQAAIDDLLSVHTAVHSTAPEEVVVAEPEGDLEGVLGTPNPIALGGSDLDLPDLAEPLDVEPASEDDLPEVAEAAEMSAPAPVEDEIDDLPTAAPPPDALDALGIDDDLALADEDDDSLGDLGNPGEWDFFEGGAPVARGSAIGRISPEVVQEVEPGTLERLRSRRSRSGFELDWEADGRSAAVSRGLAALGWGVVAALSAYAALAGLLPGVFPSSATQAPHAVGGLIAEGVEGHWIENATAGHLYVVSGNLRREAGRATEAGTQLRVRLIDADGAALAAESAAVGPPLVFEQLREWNLRDLQDQHEERALRMAWHPLGPEERRSFQAVFGELPADATAFEFLAVTAAAPSAPEPEVVDLGPVSEAALGVGEPEP